MSDLRRLRERGITPPAVRPCCMQAFVMLPVARQLTEPRVVKKEPHQVNLDPVLPSSPLPSLSLPPVLSPYSSYLHVCCFLLLFCPFICHFVHFLLQKGFVCSSKLYFYKDQISLTELVVIEADLMVSLKTNQLCPKKKEKRSSDFFFFLQKTWLMYI